MTWSLFPAGVGCGWGAQVSQPQQMGGAGSPSWNQLCILSWAPVLSRFAPLDSGSPHWTENANRHTSLSGFNKSPPISCDLPNSGSGSMSPPIFFHLSLSQFWYDIDKLQCWTSLSYEVKWKSLSCVRLFVTPWTICLLVHPRCNPRLHSLLLEFEFFCLNLSEFDSLPRFGPLFFSCVLFRKLQGRVYFLAFSSFLRLLQFCGS